MNVPTQMFAAGLSRPIHQTMKIICLGQQGTRRDKLQQKTEAIRPLGACGATVSIGSTTLDWYISPVKAVGEIKNRLHAPVFGVREFPLCAHSTRGNGRFEIRAEFGREDLYSDLSYSELNSFDFENSILPRTKNWSKDDPFKFWKGEEKILGEEERRVKWKKYAWAEEEKKGSEDCGEDFIIKGYDEK